MMQPSPKVGCKPDSSPSPSAGDGWLPSCGRKASRVKSSNGRSPPRPMTKQPLSALSSPRNASRQDTRTSKNLCNTSPGRALATTLSKQPWTQTRLTIQLDNAKRQAYILKGTRNEQRLEGLLSRNGPGALLVLETPRHIGSKSTTGQTKSGCRSAMSTEVSLAALVRSRKPRKSTAHGHTTITYGHAWC